jgi:hypothetical protein
LVWIKALGQGGERLLADRMDPIWGDIRQRNEHKSPPGQARMGDFRRRRRAGEHLPVIIEQIEVQNSGLPAFLPDTAKGGFNPVQGGQHLGWVQAGLDPGHRVHKPGLIGNRYRGAFEEPRGRGHDHVFGRKTAEGGP